MIQLASGCQVINSELITWQRVLGLYLHRASTESFRGPWHTSLILLGSAGSTLLLPLVLFVQAYNEDNLKALVDAKQVNNTAILEVMESLGAQPAAVWHSSAWIAGPVIAGVVLGGGLAALLWWVYNTYWVTAPAATAAPAAPGTTIVDANVRVRAPTGGDKYAVGANDLPHHR